MNRTCILALALLPLACVPEEPIKLGPAFPLTGTPGACIINGSISQGGGSVDLSANASYVVGFGLASDLQPPTTSNAAGNNAGSPTDNDFVFNQIQFDYKAQPEAGSPALTIPSDTVAAAGVVPALAASPTNWVILDVLGPKAVTALLPATSSGAVETVLVTMTIKGQLRSGSPTQSTAFTFPVTVFSSGFTGCGAGVRRIPSGPCGSPGGQDGTVVGCCVPVGGDGGTLPTGC